MISGAKTTLSALTTASILALYGTTGVSAAEHEHMMRPEVRSVDGHGLLLDSRYGHGHFYPAVGASIRVLPEEYRPYFFGGRSFYFSGGIWYAPGGPGFVVVRPPAGLVISVLPPYYSTVWIGGLPYYYANDVYYTWNSTQNGYVVVDPPANADQPTAAPANTADDLIVYPKNGQSTDQQAADRYECHRWAKTQTGFDPAAAAGGYAPGGGPNARTDYNRALSACLTGRGYEVK